jgi:ribonuclease P protein component
MPEKKRIFTLKRNSVLKHKSEIRLLFDGGKRINYGTIRFISLVCYNSIPGNIKIFISVPKKLIHKATDRNTIKRRIREAIRLNYPDLKNLCTVNAVNLHFGIVYSKDYIEEYNIIEQKIVLSLQNIYDEIYENLKTP